ncbi:hypothetical protein ACFPRL_17460 [Pseudoclavibacter helvolus]
MRSVAGTTDRIHLRRPPLWERDPEPRNVGGVGENGTHVRCSRRRRLPRRT